MRFLPLALVLLISLSGSGCTTELMVDGGSLPDAAAPSGQITIESERSLGLTYGQEAELVARYTEGERPVAGTTIRLALEGTAHDSTIRDVSVVTDSEGRARASIVAGSVGAVFRVRVSADRAARAYVDVSVGNEGFGGLVVAIAYAGRRDQVSRRVITVYSDTQCDPPDGYPRTAARMAILEDNEVTETSWGTLSAGLIYTVVGTVEGPTGAVLATACVDGLEIVRELDTEVALAFEDAPLLPSGRFEAELTVRATDALAQATARALDAGTALIGASEGALYLDAIEAELRERGEDAAADDVAAARLSGTLEPSLTERLGDGAAGPGVALLALSARLAERLGEIRLSGPLDLVASASSATGVWDVAHVTLGAVVAEPDGPAPVPVEPSTLAPAPTMSLSWRASADLIEVESLELRLPLGTLANAVIEAETGGAASPGEILLEGAGCEVFATWVADSLGAADQCDDACRHAACVRALDPLVDAMQIALAGADEARDHVTITGSVVLRDDGGDLVADKLEGRGLTGTWTGRLGDVGDPIGGDLIGTRLLP